MMADADSKTMSDRELRRVRSLVADLDAIVWEADARSMARTFVSESAAEILGYPPRDWVDHATFWKDHLHPDDRSRAVAEFARAVAEADRFDMEYRFMAVDGEVVWLRDLGHVVKGLDGTPAVVRGLMVEVTEQKHLEGERRQAESRFQGVVERLPAIVYIQAVSAGEDRPGPLLYVSAQLRSILGFDPENWIRDPLAWSKQLHPDDHERTIQEYERIERTDEPFSLEYRMFARDGRVVWFRDEAVLVRTPRNEPLFWQGVMYDITRLHEIENRVAEVETRHRTLVEQTPATTYIEGIEGAQGTVYVSPQTTTILGYTPEEWYADPHLWSKLLHTEDREHADDLKRAVRAGGSDYRLIAKDGRVVWVHDRASLISDEHGNPRHWQGLRVDITPSKEAEHLATDLELERATAQHLRDVDEMKNTFLQAISHDLRTPLAAIIGLAVTLAREDLPFDPEETRDIAGRIAQNARKLDRIVNNLLDLDRLSRGIVEPSLIPIDVGDLVRRVVAESDLLTERTVAITTESVVVPADLAMVDRVVENLLSNAVRHTPREARVWVRVQSVDGGALIVVEDNGMGVAPEERERIFEPFSRGGAATGPGAGIGLALVSRFVELHGGRAWVEERQGGGASFRVFLPAEPSISFADT